MQSENLNNTALIDLGATNTRFALADENGKIFYRYRTRTEKTQQKVINSLISGLEKLKKESEFFQIGISVAGPVKDEKVFLTNITGKEIDLITPLNDFFKVPVHIANDCVAAVLAEKNFGYGKNVQSLVYITMSSGIGGGVIKSGKVQYFSSVKEEIGHIKVDSEYKLLCKCGGIGHWEAFTAGISIPRFFKAWTKKNRKRINPLKYFNVIKIFEQADKKDKLALEFFDEVGKKNAHALDLISKKYSPELIVLGGSVAQNNKEIILEGILKNQKIKVPIKFTELGDEICLLGAFVYVNSTSCLEQSLLSSSS